MRRISLALALMSAVATTGCGGAYGPADNGDGKGTAGVDFTVTVNNQGPGTVSDGAQTCAANTKCVWTYASGTAVTLTATASAGNYFNGFYGACGTTGPCQLTGDADQYVVAYFSATPQAHPNWAAGHPTDSGFQCFDCHRESAAVGLAPACNTCHGAATNPYGGAPVPAIGGGAIAGKVETCGMCHGVDGNAHQARNNAWLDPNTVLKASVDSVVSTPVTGGKFDVKLKFSLKKNGQPYSVVVNALPQKTMYAGKYDGNRKFNTTTFSFSAASVVETATKGTYEVTAAARAFAPESSDAYVFVYFAEPTTALADNGSYRYYDNLAYAGKKFNDGTDWTFTSAVQSGNCSKCHPDPYLKHGYRAGPVAGLDDMVACKACHYDSRVGGHQAWTLLATDPAAYAAQDGVTTPEQNTAYAYKASTMSDTHMSHSMEFAYPQSMANCVTCHEGRLDVTLTDVNFTLATCKSCHPVTATDKSTGAPPLLPSVGTAPATGFKQGVLPAYHSAGLMYGMDCNGCHADNANTIDATTHVVTYWPDTAPEAHDGVGPVGWFGHVEPLPLLKDLHNGGYDNRVYNAAQARYDGAITSQISAASFDSATNTVTATVTMTGLDANAVVKPTVVVSLYGYQTKDFVLSGHGSISSALDAVCPDAGGTRGQTYLEYTYGATQRVSGTNPCSGQASNSPRLGIEPAAPTAGTTSWTVTADLALWAADIASGKVSRIELAFLPGVGIDQTVVVQTDATKAGYNPAIAAGGVSREISLVGTGSVVADTAAYGRKIVDPAKCNKCHEALAIEFHSPNYGSAGVVGCRVCHTVNDGGSHLEMQSRSIDSYVHALHSMQYMDVQNVDWTDPVAALRYAHHVESTYPKFTTQDCESCHFPGTYNPPAPSRALPSVLSAASTLKAGFPSTRTQFTEASVVVGPAARACGSCHRSEFIKEGDATGLAELDAHTAEYGIRLNAVSSGPVYVNATLSSTIDALCTLNVVCPAP